MRIIDLSMTIQPDMMIFKNREANRPVHTIDRKIPPDSVNESSLKFFLHTGTHFDSPFHMLENGAPTECLPLDKLVTRCKVLDLTDVQDGIGQENLEGLPIKPGDFLLLKTKNSLAETFDPDYIYLKADGAAWLAARQIKGVGIDSLGIERAQPGHETHISLLEKDIIIIEGLRLKDVPAGEYILVALPIKIKDADGAPARVILIDGSEDVLTSPSAVL